MSNHPFHWFIEHTHTHQAHMHGVDRFIYNTETSYQKASIVESKMWGRCLLIDGKIQSSAYDEHIYHEALIHPAMLMADNPQKILIAGGGEGAVLREIIKHPSVKNALMVDIDQEIVEFCKKYLPSWNAGAFDDSRCDTIFADAREFIKNTNQKFDIIFMDLPEPLEDSPCYLLYTVEYYNLLLKKLNPRGLIALQADNLNPRLASGHTRIFNTIKQVFKHVASYGCYIPSFNTRWGFIVASDEICLEKFSSQDIEERLQARALTNLLFYDGITHQHLFSQTKDIRDKIKQETRIIRDNEPFLAY